MTSTVPRSLVVLNSDPIRSLEHSEKNRFHCCTAATAAEAAVVSLQKAGTLQGTGFGQIEENSCLVIELDLNTLAQGCTFQRGGDLFLITIVQCNVIFAGARAIAFQIIPEWTLY